MEDNNTREFSDSGKTARDLAVLRTQLNGDRNRLDKVEQTVSELRDQSSESRFRIQKIEEMFRRREMSRARAIGWAVTLIITIIGALIWPVIQLVSG